MAVGVTETVPGVSGSTVAMIQGIYECLIYSLSILTTNQRKKYYLMVIMVIGFVLSILKTLLVYIIYIIGSNENKRRNISIPKYTCDIEIF
ncbi:undecaprenyl phosphate translocase family protein [Cerasibacillus sp.]|uniref:undecaprenyl phosphate translocase family protein n=1 Tax=Cerasibacillus sp. TaxID=2498711 RepID=UPI0039C85E78